MADFAANADRRTFDPLADTSAQDSEEKGPDLFEIEMKRYAKALEADTDAAMRQYGFTLFHSLPPLEQVALLEKLGFEPATAHDHFARAALAISREDYRAAVTHLQKCLAADPEFADAVYNLALCHEKLGNKTQAVQQWNRFLELTESSEDRSAVAAHLAQLGA